MGQNGRMGRIGPVLREEEREHGAILADALRKCRCPEGRTAPGSPDRYWFESCGARPEFDQAMVILLGVGGR